MSGFLRTSINLVALAVLTVGLVAYAGYQWAQDIFFDDRYPVAIELGETGGLVEEHEVTVLGDRVGRIGTIELTPGGVRMELLIEPDRAVPGDAVVQVIRRSAIGEQTLNLIPVGADWEAPAERLIPRLVEVAEGWEPAEPGAEITALEVETPVDMRTLIGNVEDLFRAIDTDDLHTTVVELAAAVGGRGETLVDLNVQAMELNETLVAGIPDFERLIDSSGPVLEAMSDSRQEIAASITHLADLSELLAENRPVMERLATETGTRALEETDALIRENRANLTCLVDDFHDFNVATLFDGGGWLAQLLDFNQHFFGAVDIVFQWDPYRPKKNWARVADLVMSGDGGGAVYNERVPTPMTRPGAACVTPFGVGVNAVRQADHQPPDPTSPGIDWAPLVDEGEREGEVPERPTAVTQPDEPLPATGAGGLGALGPLAAALALLLWRRRRR